MRSLPQQRLAHLKISTQTAQTPHQVVHHLGALQAQDYLSMLWAVALRTPNATEADIEQAIADRQIVRTWPMRGTLHLVTAEDHRWWVQLMKPRIQSVMLNEKRLTSWGLDRALVYQAVDVIVKRLQGTQLTREELADALTQNGIDPSASRLSTFINTTITEGWVCYGARRGKQHTFALVDEWLAPAPLLEREDALAELTKRYFTSHGPATEQDFVWWTGLTLSDARLGIQLAGGTLEKVTVAGTAYWMGTDHQDVKPEPLSVHLLPPFDEYLLGYAKRDAVLNPDHATKVAPGKNGIFNPIIVIDGQVVGLWKRTLKPKKVIVQAIPFSLFTAEEEARIHAEFERYGKFLGLPLEIER